MLSTASIFSELVSGDGDGEELLSLDSSVRDSKPRAARTLGCRSATVCTQKLKVSTSNILSLLLLAPTELEIGLRKPLFHLTELLHDKAKKTGLNFPILDPYT